LLDTEMLKHQPNWFKKYLFLRYLTGPPSVSWNE